jgi:hypothetical protein
MTIWIELTANIIFVRPLTPFFDDDDDDFVFWDGLCWYVV